MKILANRWEPASLFIVFGVPSVPCGTGTSSGRRTPYQTVLDKKKL
jgi:hypothetical protein